MIKGCTDVPMGASDASFFCDRVISKKEAACLRPLPLLFGVELEGFEPSSKQGNHMLSTCLFRPSVFVLRQDPDHQSQPYPLNFTNCAGPQPAISDFPAPLDPQIRNNILGAMSRSITL